jgi:uncharacterized protein with HEPN domain
MTSEGSGLRLADFLDHIAEAARLAREYVGGMSQESFRQDRRTQQAVVLNLMTIGEAAARIANEHKDFAGNCCHYAPIAQTLNTSSGLINTVGRVVAAKLLI